MKLILSGKAPVHSLKDCDILSDDVTAPDNLVTDFASAFFHTRTSRAERDILEILGFDEKKIETHRVLQEKLTLEKLWNIRHILEEAGSPTDVDQILALNSNGATYTGFISLFE